MADYAPVYAGGSEPFTATTSAAVTGGRLLSVSGDGTVAHAAADDEAIGVAAYDAPSGGRVAVWPLANVIHETPAPAAVSAGAVIVAAASGQVAAAAAQTGLSLLGVAVADRDSDNNVRWVGR
jgi:hypothetical protein